MEQNTVSRPGIVKVSVLLPEDVHRQLKLASVQRRVTIQKVMEDAAQSWIEGPKPDIEGAKSELETDALGLAHYNEPTDIGPWLDKCKRILISGNKLAILGCTTNLDAMEALVEQGEKGG